MISNGNTKPVDRATPVLKMPRGSDAAKVEAARATVKAAQQSPQWNANPRSRR